MDRITGDSVRNLANAVRTDIRGVQTDLQNADAQVGALDLALTNTAILVDELCERIRYLGWSTDDAILDCLSDGHWRTRQEVEEALQRSGAPYRSTANRLRMLTQAGKLEHGRVPRPDRGNAFGNWRLPTD